MIDLSPRSNCPGWSQAARHLSRADSVLGRIIAVTGPCTLAPRRDHFAALCQSIITQQISTAVAVTIYRRFRGLFPHRRPSPARLLQLPAGTLRDVGLSRQKIDYLTGLADGFVSRQIRPAALRAMSDEAVIQTLTQVRGIGRWTAEMFLIFALNRPDLLPVDDLGLRNGVRQFYKLRKIPTPDDLTRLAEPWRPYRSIATWHIWRATSWPTSARVRV